MSAEADDLQGAGEDFIRYLAAKYFIVDFSNSPLYPIFGTGWGSLALGNKLEYCKHVLHFYISDVGIIGYYSTVGLVGVSAIIFTYTNLSEIGNILIWGIKCSLL